MDETSGPALYRFSDSVTFRVSSAPQPSEENRFPGFSVTVRDSSGVTWVVRKRYCDFQALNMNLQQALPQFKLSIAPVRIAFNQNDKVIMDIQKQRLQTYLDKLAQHPELLASDLVWEFFNPQSQRNLWETLSSRSRRPHVSQGVKFASVPAGFLEKAAAVALESELGSPMSTVSALSTGHALLPDVASPSAIFSPTLAAAYPSAVFSQPLDASSPSAMYNHTLHKRTNSNDTFSTFSISSVDTVGMTNRGSSLMSGMSICQEPTEERELHTASQNPPQRGLFWRMSSFGREPLPDILSSAELMRDL